MIDVYRKSIDLIGSARLINDLDIVYARDDGNRGRLVAALRPLGGHLRGTPVGLPFHFDERPSGPA